jgi:hypothetical protein
MLPPITPAHASSTTAKPLLFQNFVSPSFHCVQGKLPNHFFMLIASDHSLSQSLPVHANMSK